MSSNESEDILYNEKSKISHYCNVDSSNDLCNTRDIHKGKYCRNWVQCGNSIDGNWYSYLSS